MIDKAGSLVQVQGVSRPREKGVRIEKARLPIIWGKRIRRKLLKRSPPLKKGDKARTGPRKSERAPTTNIGSFEKHEVVGNSGGGRPRFVANEGYFSRSATGGDVGALPRGVTKKKWKRRPIQSIQGDTGYAPAVKPKPKQEATTFPNAELSCPGGTKVPLFKTVNVKGPDYYVTKFKIR